MAKPKKSGYDGLNPIDAARDCAAQIESRDTAPSAIDPKPLAPVSRSIAVYEDLPHTVADRPICSWPLDTVEGRARLHQVISGTSSVLWDQCESAPLEILITDLAAHYSSWESAENPGELIAGPMLTMIGPSGQWHTGSDAVYESLRQLMMLEGPPPWNPALWLRVSRAPTRNKRMRMAVVYLGYDHGGAN